MKLFVNNIAGILKQCPRNTRLNKVILYNIPKRDCDFLRLKANELSNMTNGNSEWNISVGRVDFASQLADVKFTKI